MTDLLCGVIDCHRPGAIICSKCARRLCVTHYGTGSSSFCQRCFDKLKAEQAVIEERRREATAESASS